MTGGSLSEGGGSSDSRPGGSGRQHDDRVILVHVDSREKGEETARRLLGAGIPSFVEEGAARGSHVVWVMSHDAARAAAVLGLQPAPEELLAETRGAAERAGASEVGAEDGGGKIFGVPRRQFWRYVVYYLAALVVVSVGAFVVTVWLLGGFSGEPSVSEIRSQLTAD
ncbi:MAG: hypothetical protein KatS3mg008_0992 [Acidimicrobiales bacterium]|nr:MAG: hypothetical protein KatS3mg008_0992 [Acidimicrobiales bacterium]